MIDPKLAAALVKARSNITNPERDKKGVFAGHKYAALENVLDEVQPHLQAEGVILMQDIQTARGGYVPSTCSFMSRALCLKPKAR